MNRPTALVTFILSAVFCHSRQNDSGFKCSPDNLVLGNVSFMATFAGITPSEGVFIAKI